MPSESQIAQSDRANLESEMQSGKVRARRRNTLVIGVVPMTIKMPTAAFLLFKAFVRDTLGHGAGEFTMPVWDGTGCPQRQCRLRKGGQYSAMKVGGSFMVSFELDVRGL